MNKNNPELRFSNFTSNPMKYKLSEITERIKSYSLSRSVETIEDTGYKYIHYGDIHRKVANIIDRESRLPNIKPGDYELLKRGDLVIADASEDYQGIAAPSIVNDDISYNVVAGLHTIALRPIKADSLYLYYLFNSQKFRKYGYKVGTGMKVFGMSVSNLVRFESYIPSIPEQVEIGVLLKKVDQIMDLQQQLLDNHKQLKKAMLQKMFPQKGESVPRVRFAGFTDNWEQRKLGEVSPLRGGFAFQSTKFQLKGIPIIRITNILSNERVGGNYVYYEQQENDSKYSLPDKSAILAMSGATTGKVSVLDNPNNEKIYQNQRVGYFKDLGIVNYTFISTIVKSNLFINQLKSVLVAGAQPNISSKEIDEFYFYFPTEKEEQTKIGDFFKQLDETIVLHEKKLETYQNLKKAMLQKMFV